MGKLFAIESAEGGSGGLLIDKVIQQADKDKAGLRVTADLIKQRQKLKVEINKELKEGDQAAAGGEGEDADDSSVTNEDTQEDGTDQVAEDAGEQTPGADEDETGEETASEEGSEADSDKTTQEGEEKKAVAKDTAPKDASDESQDEDGLSSLVGSALTKEKDAEAAPVEKSETPPKVDKVAEESYTRSVLPVRLFDGIAARHHQHRLALEEYNLGSHVQDAKNQPVAYVKDEVLQALNKLVMLANLYLSKNAPQVGSAHKALLSLSEQLTVFQQCHQANKLHLTLKVVTDEDKLKALGVPGVSNLKETGSLLVRYLGESTTLVAAILENDLSTLSSSLSVSGYKNIEGEWVYHKVLPGFVQMKVAAVEYQDYLRTKYENYQAYRVHVFRVQELYDIDRISLNKDADLVSVMEKLSAVLMQAAIMTDNLKDLSTQYAELVEKVKAVCYDIGEGKVKGLAELDIDSHLKDFIRFKVCTELLGSAVDLAVEYTTSVLGTFEQLIELDN